MFRFDGMMIAAAALVGIAGATARADEKLAPTVDYFVGESKTTSPDGKPIRTTLSLVKRVVTPADNRIEEEVLSVTANGPARLFVTILEVNGNKYTVTEKSKAFEGEGELIGEPWKWKEWKSVTKLPGGAGTVTSEDKLTDRGMSAKKTFAGADGTIIFKFEDSLTRISPATYDILHAKLAPAEKK